MRAFWNLFGRELRGQRLLYLASLAIGVLVAIVPSLPGARTANPAEVRGAAAAVAAALWSLAVAVGLGATALARDLREGRLAFDFRLPAGAAAIGAARIGAGLLAAIGAGALVLAVPQPLGADLGILSAWLPFSPLAVTLVFLLSHTVTLSLAGDRRWLSLDAASLALLGAALWTGWQPFYRYYAPAGWGRLFLLGGILLTLALVVAIHFQLRAGRSELDRAHRAFSLALAGGVVVAALTLVGYAHWYFHPAESDLRRPKRVELGAGWTLTTGEAAGRPSTSFALLHHVSGRTLPPVPTPALGFFNPYAAVATDGSRLAWLEIGPGRRDLELWTLDARDPAAAPRRAFDGLQWSQERWALSPDGARTVSLGRLGDDFRLYVDEIATGRRLATFALPGILEARSLAFVSADRVRGVGRDSWEVTASNFPFEVDLATGKLTRSVSR